MRRWVLVIMLVFVGVQVVSAICCQRNTDCIVTETCQDAACGNCTIAIHNRDGSVNVSRTEMTVQTLYTYTFNISTNLSSYDTYPYLINCTNNKVCNGDCQIEIKDNCGRNTNMTTGIVLFLLLFNLGVFLTPFFVKKFHDTSKAGDYIIRRIIWMAGFIILWFNSLIFRMLAQNYSLGIDDQLKAYWWVFTWGVLIIIFTMTYVMVKGSMGLMQEAKMRVRLGDDKPRYY